MMPSATMRLGLACGYFGAETVEFPVDADRNFY